MIQKIVAAIFEQVVGVDFATEVILLIFAQGVKKAFSDGWNAALQKFIEQSFGGFISSGIGVKQEDKSFAAQVGEFGKKSALPVVATKNSGDGNFTGGSLPNGHGVEFAFDDEYDVGIKVFIGVKK